MKFKRIDECNIDTVGAALFPNMTCWAGPRGWWITDDRSVGITLVHSVDGNDNLLDLVVVSIECDVYIGVVNPTFECQRDGVAAFVIKEVIRLLEACTDKNRRPIIIQELQTAFAKCGSGLPWDAVEFTPMSLSRFEAYKELIREEG